MKKQLTTWKTVIIGNNKKPYLDLLKKKDIYVSSYAQDLLEKMPALKMRETLDLVILSVKDLGLEDGATTEKIYAKAKEQGLELCPPEVGPALRLAYADQPMGDYFWIAMETITDRRGDPSIFYLDRDGAGLELSVGWDGPGDRWGSSLRFVFRLRKLDLGISDTQTSLEPQSLALESAIKVVKDAGYLVYKQL